MSSPWSWKAKREPVDGARPTLLYEPGNWGDLLKLAWLLEVLEGRRHAVFDLFAGAPDYPLPPRSRRRLAVSGLVRLQTRLAPWLARDRWPGSAALAADAAGCPVRVCDAHDAHRAALAADPRFAPLPGADAWEALAALAPPADALFLIDPYDFLGEWRTRLAAVAGAAEKNTVLLYVYNRAGRSPEALRDYRAFRAALADARAGRPLWTARVAADTLLPTAWHEMFFLPGPIEPAGPALTDRLEATALALAAGMARAAVVESEP